MKTMAINTSTPSAAKDWINKIHQGDALDLLRQMPDHFVDMVITSPPYWCLRDYGVEGQLGLEPTFEEYSNKLCGIFDEVKRILKQGGSCWVNLGDTYSGNKKGKTDQKVSDYLKNTSKSINKKAVIQAKCLCQIPSRFAIEMTHRGWILRNEIIWHKPNAMPCSVKDRFTVDFEKLFFFSKSKRYYFEKQYEPYVPNSDMQYRKTLRMGKQYKVKGSYKKNTPLMDSRIAEINPKGRNKRCVWKIPTKSFKGAHFAVYPLELIQTPIKASCPPNGIVLDIFMGAGTTALVALKLGRKFLGCELNPTYITIAEKRLKPYLDELKEAA